MHIKKIKEDLNKWGDILCSWIGRLHAVKMSILSKLIHRFNAIPIKITVRIFVGIDKLILKCMCKGKGVKITKSILKKKNEGGINLPDSKT